MCGTEFQVFLYSGDNNAVRTTHFCVEKQYVQINVLVNTGKSKKYSRNILQLYLEMVDFFRCRRLQSSDGVTDIAEAMNVNEGTLFMYSLIFCT